MRRISNEAAERRTDTACPRDRPYPAHWSVRRALSAYLAENGFTVEAYDAPRTDAVFFGVHVSVPNTPRHRIAIMLHDLHHVVTGYGTDPTGEGEISAWELRRGLRGLDLYVSAIVLGGTLLGAIVAPGRTARAWRASGTRNLFELDEERYRALLDSTVGELRELLGVPAEGLAERSRRLHGNAPKPAG